MNILWITEFFPDEKLENTTGGVESRYFFLAKNLRKNGVTIKIINRVFKSASTDLNFLDFFKRVVYFLTAVKKGLQSDFDLVEGGNLTTYFCAWIVGRIKSKPVVFCIHDVFGYDWIKNFGPIGALGLIAEKITLALPGVSYLAVSHTVKEKLITLGIPQGKITVSHNGTIVEGARPVKTKAYDLITVSRLISYKNVSHIIEAVAYLKKTHPKIKFLIVGHGPEMINLKNQAKNLNLTDNISFAGFVKSHHDVLDLMSKAKVYGTASTVEGFGITLIEAVGLGVPYVAYSIPVTVEITNNGQGGLLVNPDNKHDFAQSVDRLLTDQALYKKLSHEAKSLALKYNWAIISRELKSFYAERV